MVWGADEAWLEFEVMWIGNENDQMKEVIRELWAKVDSCTCGKAKKPSDKKDSKEESKKPIDKRESR